MNADNKAGKIFLIVMLMLLLSGLTGCSRKPVIVLDEAKTIHLNQGQPAPWDGWLLTDSAMATLLETVEECNK